MLRINIVFILLSIVGIESHCAIASRTVDLGYQSLNMIVVNSDCIVVGTIFAQVVAVKVVASTSCSPCKERTVERHVRYFNLLGSGRCYQANGGGTSRRPFASANLRFKSVEGKGIVASVNIVTVGCDLSVGRFRIANCKELSIFTTIVD